MKHTTHGLFHSSFAPSRPVFLCLWILLFGSSSWSGYCGNLSWQYARERAQQVGQLNYDLALQFQPNADTFQGKLTLTFQLKKAAPHLFLDFDGEQVTSVLLAGEPLPGWRFQKEDGKILLPTIHLSPGTYQLVITFVAPYGLNGVGLHHYQTPSGFEYLYTDLQPDAANRVFPCFDQPDLRASFKLSLLMPPRWEVSANELCTSRHRQGELDLLTFAPTKPIATYLFNLVAGDYAVFYNDNASLPMRLLCRQELTPYLNSTNVFETTTRAIQFFTDYFGVPYPFSKYDTCFIPQYNSAAMENPGSVTVNEVFILGFDPSESDLIDREQILIHEAAHMWFGNLVTMTWWNDLWLNESFASFMETQALRHQGRETWMLTNREKISAQQEDSLETTHPIVTQVMETAVVRANFDKITYQKGMAVLEQLAMYVGAEAFRQGIQAY